MMTGNININMAFKIPCRPNTMSLVHAPIPLERQHENSSGLFSFHPTNCQSCDLCSETLMFLDIFCSIDLTESVLFLGMCCIYRPELFFILYLPPRLIFWYYKIWIPISFWYQFIFGCGPGPTFPLLFWRQCFVVFVAEMVKGLWV